MATFRPQLRENEEMKHVRHSEKTDMLRSVCVPLRIGSCRPGAEGQSIMPVFRRNCGDAGTWGCPAGTGMARCRALPPNYFTKPFSLR
jgi:hypothetical protein